MRGGRRVISEQTQSPALDTGVRRPSQRSIDPVVLIRFEKVLITLPALKLIEERLS